MHATLLQVTYKITVTQCTRLFQLAHLYNLPRASILYFVWDDERFSPLYDILIHMK